MSSITRRRFLQSSTGLAASPLLFSNTFGAAPSNVLNVAIIGLGGRSQILTKLIQQIPGVRIAGLCDPDSKRIEQAASISPDAAQATDMRDLFALPDIDAVLICTTNHWHCLASIWALQAGKHVYVEKPLGNTEWEGQQVVHAAEATGLVCQIGTQQRSDPMQAEIKQFLHQDKALGAIESVRVNRFGERKPIGRRTEPMIPPRSVDYDLWLGPAEEKPIYRDKLHYDWHWDWNTGSGEMGNWGVHILDDVRNNALLDKVAAPERIAVAAGRFAWNDAGETPNALFATMSAGGLPVTFSLSNLQPKEDAPRHTGPGSGYVIYCEGGRLEGRRGGAVAYDQDGVIMRVFGSDQPFAMMHLENFFDAVRTKDSSLLNAPIRVGCESTTWCNLVNVAVQSTKGLDGGKTPVAEEAYEDVRRMVEHVAGEKVADSFRLGPALTYDSKQRKFVDELASDANDRLRSEGRGEFALPSTL